MKKLFVLTGIIVIALVAIILFNTYLAEDLQPEVVPTEIAAEPGDLVAGHLVEAISFKTISHHPAMMDTEVFDTFHQWMIATYDDLFTVVQTDTIGTHSLLLKWRGSDPDLKPVLFMAHQDVVPVDESSADQWDAAPFGSTPMNGFVYGRGTLDDKGSLIAILEAAESLAESGFTPDRDIYFFFGQDEEIGGENGARLAAQHLKEKGIRFECVLDEGGIISDGLVPGLSQPVALIGTSEKGYISLDIDAEYKGGHSSIPEDTNSIIIAGEVIRRLQEHDFTPRLCDPMDGFLSYLGPHFNFTTRMAAANRWLFEGLILSTYGKTASGSALIKTTWAPTVIRGGIKDNVIPMRTLLTVNSRILPGETAETVIAHYESVLEGLPVTIRVHDDFFVDPSPVSDHNGRVFTRLSESVKRSFPDCLISPYIVLGATDGRYMTGISDDVFRFTPFRFGEGDLSRLHGVNERVSVDGIQDAVRFYIDAIAELSSSEE